MTDIGHPKKKKKPAWAEDVPGRWVHRLGYTLTRIRSTKGWELRTPVGELLVTQLELFAGMGVVTEWADQYINYLVKVAKVSEETTDPQRKKNLRPGLDEFTG